ncbi:hypothetical protein PMm318_A12130 [Pseudomonas moorei]
MISSCGESLYYVRSRETPEPSVARSRLAYEKKGATFYIDSLHLLTRQAIDPTLLHTCSHQAYGHFKHPRIP